MKSLLILFALILCLTSAEKPTRILAPVESPAKLIEGIEFSVVTQSDWRIHDSSVHYPTPVILQLRITNRTNSAILFPTLDSFLVRLKKSDGVSVRFEGHRDESLITPNILLQPGSSLSLPINATIEYKPDSRAVKLIVKDGTGTIMYATLPAGTYSVAFQVNPCNYDFARWEGKLLAPLWAGKGVTESIGFNLTLP